MTTIGLTGSAIVGAYSSTDVKTHSSTVGPIDFPLPTPSLACFAVLGFQHALRLKNGCLVKHMCIVTLLAPASLLCCPVWSSLHARLALSQTQVNVGESML